MTPPPHVHTSTQRTQPWLGAQMHPNPGAPDCLRHVPAISRACAGYAGVYSALVAVQMQASRQGGAAGSSVAGKEAVDVVAVVPAEADKAVTVVVEKVEVTDNTGVAVR